MNDIAQLVGIALKIVLLLMVCFCTIHSLFMIYHWYTFGQNKKTATVATITYLSGLAIFFMIMTGAVLTYSFS
jgi:hypothetical protein